MRVCVSLCMMTTNGNGMLGMIDLNPLSVCSSSTSCSPAHTRSLHTSLSHVNTYIYLSILCVNEAERDEDQLHFI